MVAKVVATLKDGRVIARADISTTVVAGTATKKYVTATFPDLKAVEELIQTNFTPEPNVQLTVEDPSISGNVVGVTVYCASGTTLTGHMLAVGH